jgi:F-type H+-transporting ATPase subunit alpha
LSVSRVGGNAQIKAMKQVAGSLRLDLAQYREMAAFAQFGSDLDKATQAQLAKGERLVEILKQGQYQPLPVANQIVVIYAGVRGFLDGYPVPVLQRYEQELSQFIESKHADILKEIDKKKALDEALDQKITNVLEEFKKVFIP